MSAWTQDTREYGQWNRQIGPFEVHAGGSGPRYYASALGFCVSSNYKSLEAAMRGAERKIAGTCEAVLRDLAMPKRAPAAAETGETT